MKLYTNEIVFRGHPDKVCDQISDALLDAFLAGDKTSRCGIEVMGGKGKIFITGEVTTSSEVNVEEVVRRVLKDVGYIDQNNRAINVVESGNPDEIEIVNNLGKQSHDIARLPTISQSPCNYSKTFPGFTMSYARKIRDSFQTARPKSLVYMIPICIL